jgi:hypothetical protein
MGRDSEETIARMSASHMGERNGRFNKGKKGDIFHLAIHHPRKGPSILPTSPPTGEGGRRGRGQGKVPSYSNPPTLRGRGLGREGYIYILILNYPPTRGPPPPHWALPTPYLGSLSPRGREGKEYIYFLITLPWWARTRGQAALWDGGPPKGEPEAGF